MCYLSPKQMTDVMISDQGKSPSGKPGQALECILFLEEAVDIALDSEQLILIESAMFDHFQKKSKQKCHRLRTFGEIQYRYC